jgi:hypothetical protein
MASNQREMCVKSVRKGCVSSLFIVGVAVGVLNFELPGRAQGRMDRRSGPRDWSHNQMVAAGWGPDDPAVRRDWRTLRRHMQLEDARNRRAPFAEWIGWLRDGGFFRGFPRPADPSAPSSSDVKLDWSLNTGGTGSVIGYPAKFSFDVSASNCSDVIYYTVNQNGSATAPNVIAITNPYVGCPGNPANLTPTVKFALRLTYGTGTSPTLSLDGTVLYVMESRPSANGGPILHAINVNNITSSPGSYNFGTGAWTSVHTLAAPTGTPTSEQRFQLTFASTTNALSSPYYDYDNHRIYFGDSAGRVHRIRNANATSAAEDTGWPVACTAGAFQSPMVYNNQVVTGSTDGYLYRIDVSGGTPACVASQRLGGGTAEGGAGGLTSPMIDVANNKILVTTGDTFSGEFKAVAAYNLNFAAGEAPVATATLGTADGVVAQFPALDNDFWMNNDGNIYAVGTGSTTNTLLIRVPYNGVTMLSPAGYAAFHRSGAAASVASSPVVEFLTAAAVTNPDFIFVGGNGGTYPFMNRISSKFNGTAGSPVAMSGFFGPPSGVSSGISVDTRTTATTGTTATANIYFGTAGGSVQSTIVQLAQQF